jgi:hypothetical protein
MRTKEDIITPKLSQAMAYTGATMVMGQGMVELAMEEWGKESSLDFAKWLNDNCIVATGGQWRHHNKWIQIKTTEELYEMYLQEKSIPA